VTSDDYWNALSSELGLTRVGAARGGMVMTIDANGTHFIVFDPELIPLTDRERKLAEILANPADFVWAY
jgi:hypothetical protein